ncbi:uncharacterized protein LOC135161807 [Diachasmimorpha longicaudata]|uniref:uncharacterized protein LOC135161807 n=1 Tax=Diachasmimorpha longicaudata TaxID=58733 RepID=UPI0030B87017
MPGPVLPENITPPPTRMTEGSFSSSLRPPAFSVDSPRIWFTQMEANFAIAGIVTERDKFNRIVASIDTNICKEVSDVIDPIPTDTPYQKLKHALISRFTSSQEARMRQLLDKESLGSRTPSAHLRHLRSLVPGIGEDVLKSKWLSHLPNQMEAFLSEDEGTDLTKLAERADRLNEIFSPGSAPMVNAVAHTPTPTSQESEIAALSRQIAALQASVRQLKATTSRPSTKASENRSRSTSRNRLPNNTGVCWYHRKFGKQAKKCIPGCKREGNANGGQ